MLALYCSVLIIGKDLLASFITFWDPSAQAGAFFYRYFIFIYISVSLQAVSRFLCNI